jgi:hypothetical protein
MSLTTYAQLQNAVLSFTHRANIQDAVSADIIPDLIRLGELWIFRKAKTREMETALNLTLSNGVATVPTDYTGLKHARLDGSPSRPVRQRPAQWIYEKYPLRSSDSKPWFIAVDAGQFVFGPFPDSNYTLLGTYYAKPASIATSANALFLANPDVYLYAAICEAEPYLKNDKRLPMWMAKRDQIMADMNDEAEEDEYGAGGLEVVPG